MENKLEKLNSAVSLIDGIYHEVACKLGISDSVMTVLYTLVCSGNTCMLHDIYTFYGVPKQTVNSAVRKMEKDGLVYLEKHDGKSKKISLTQKGRNLADRTVVKLINAENRILDSWKDSDVDLYIALSKRYADDLKAQCEMISEAEE
ncbi:MAG: MarR family transcriptional regulator [Ruminococcus flavefaciens]|nr:MarR family transcriptional regulator [Ruminococcus flavefaciens]MCM1230305.1 MarR family transcriptional regulator [Ruminococcus flavefaciens]